ncbi:unnamed protein product [Paramecium sonneborni]|uniref:Uncharacterized protein n=1 Tax=Paramecium sonneborni TaxID=65129 RepID=A0A8S1MZQ8_9CILI|nr:unnamed protein product [Paramecium sonneborni]
MKKIGTQALLMNKGSTPFSVNLGGDSKQQSHPGQLKF